MKTLVAGIGNIFMNDDAFGVEVMKRLSPERFPEGVGLWDVGIGGIHLAYELVNGYDALVLVDCMPSGEEPGTVSVYEVTQESDGSWAQIGARDEAFADAHGFEPHVALNMVAALGGEIGRVYLVACEPESLEPGMALSPRVAASLETAADEVKALVHRLHSEKEAVR